MAPSSTRPLWQRFVVFLIPLSISNILQSMSGTVNAIFVGQMIGTEALAAMTIFFPIMIFLISFVVGLASGSAILIGQAWGAKNVEMVKRVTATTLTAAFALGLVIALLGALFTRQLMDLLGAPEDIVGLATSYGRVMLMGMPGFFVFLIYTSVLRGVGDTMTPLLALVISVLVGLVVTPVLIQGWGGLPQLGLMSAAVAFISGFVVVLAFLAIYLNWRRSPMAPDRQLLSQLGVDLELLGKILKLGIPAGVGMVVSSISAIVILGIVNDFGSEATAAYGAVNQVMGYVQFPAMSVSMAASIFAAQTIGAGHVDQLGKVTRTALAVNTLFTGGLVLVAYLFSENLVALFITDPAVIEMTETLLHIVLWSVVLFGYGSVFSAVMRASGDVLVPMVLSLGAIICIEIPAALLLSRVFGLEGVWFGYCCSFIALMVLQATYYLGWWRKKEVRALV